MSSIKVKRAPGIDTEIRVPGDKSISHRAAIFSALSNGPCVVTGYLTSEDCLNTLKILQQLGIKIEQPGPDTLIIHGARGVFQKPEGDLDCGNSGTAMRLLAGLVAGQPFECTLTGDASLSKRPMKRIIDPLSQMGAGFTASGEKGTPPLRIHGGPLTGITYRSPVASAQVKSAILIAGLFAKGKTTVIEPALSRNHTEHMLRYYLATVNSREIEALDEHGQPAGREFEVSTFGGQILESRDFQIPGDISSAAFWLVAAAVQPGARLLVEDVGLNETRSGLLTVLLRMGATVREVIEELDQVERMGSVEVRGTRLKGAIIQGAEIPNVIDEIPILAVAGALAEGVTEIRDARELRVKETDRIAAVATNLRAMGVSVEETEDGMLIYGGSKLRGAKLDSFGDHRIAMAFAIAGLFADGETVIRDTDCIATSYPGFEETLAKILKPSRLARTAMIDPSRQS